MGMKKQAKRRKRIRPGKFTLHEQAENIDVASLRGEKIYDFHQFTRLKTGNDLVAEPMLYSSVLSHFNKMKNDEISLYFNGLRFYYGIPPENNYLTLCCFTGVPYTDAVSITNDNIYTDDNGALWLKYMRKKNEHLGRVKLLPEAIALIEKYRSTDRKELFPMIHHPNLRRHMKGLRNLAGIKSNLVYHMGCHTFRNLITLEAGVPIETISKMLGHTNLATTQLYAKVTPKKLFDDMDIFIKATSDMTLVL